MQPQRKWIRRLAFLVLTLILSALVSREAKTVSQTSLAEEAKAWPAQHRVLVLAVPLGLILSMSLLKRRRAQKVRVRRRGE